MTRTKFCYFVAVILGIVFANNVLAEVPPLLNAKGKQQQCDSLEVWTKTAQELAGVNVIGGTIISDRFINKIAPAFADSVFEPFMGKPYRELSKSEKKKIYKIVDRCLTKAGTRGFLPVLFDTSSRSTTATNRSWVTSLENVPEEVAAGARIGAEARAKRQRQFNEGRPQLVARSLPGDPKAVKRQKLTKRMCSTSSSGWHFLFNDYVFDGEAVIASNDGYRGHGIRPCSNGMAMARFIPNVTSLGRVPNSSMSLLSIGDICGTDPEVLFLYGGIRAMPKYDQYPRNNRLGQYSPDFGTIQYLFYVPSGSDGAVHNRIVNQVESGLLATREVLMKQCRTVPDSIRVVGGALEKGYVSAKEKRSRKTPENLDYWEFYSGTFHPNEPEKRLVHDDQRLAATYSAMATEYAAYIRAEQEEARNASDGSLALGFFALVIAAKYLANPCYDTSIEYSVRDNAGCFD